MNQKQFPWPALIGAVWILSMFQGSQVLAAERQVALGFDEPEPTWQVQFNPTQLQLKQHQRNTRYPIQGTAAEYLRFTISQQGGRLRLEHPLPTALVIQELKVSLKIRATQNGIRVGLRIVFPHERDPATGQPAIGYVFGSKYAGDGEWQTLECQTLEKQINEQVYLLRSRLANPGVTAREVYVDQVFLELEARPQSLDLLIDDLQFGPVFSPHDETPVMQTSHRTQASFIPVKFRLDQLLVQDQPFFPRIVPWHGETVEQLKQAGVNVVWVPDYRNAELLESLASAGLRIMATPPRPNPTELDQAGAGVGLMPFANETAPILFWYPGSRIPAAAKDELIPWVQQIRDADRNFERPIMADVTGLERIYSRHVSMLGVSRHVIHSDFSLKQYRDWLVYKRRLARPGTFVWTWVQTAAEPRRNRQRLAAGRLPLVLEPEQIRLQVYAALAAGCRGVGFWKETGLDNDATAARERAMILQQLNAELELMEPFLATGTLDGQVGFRLKLPDFHLSRGRLDFQNATIAQREQQAMLREKVARDQLVKRLSSELEAAIIRSDAGALVLPVWYDSDAQFVPGQMAGNDARIVVEGVHQSASAWEITPTQVRNVSGQKRVAGGLEVTLPKFDQTAIIVVTSNKQAIDRLQEQVRRMAPANAESLVELATLKHERVKSAINELEAQGIQQPDGSALIARSDTLLRHARAALERQQYHAAREYSLGAMQLQRVLQHASWLDATLELSAPVSSPHALSFQTLPDHWKLWGKLGRNQVAGEHNLLRSGSFEDCDTMRVEGWSHRQLKLAEDERLYLAADLYPAPQSGDFALRLEALPLPNAPAPAVLPGRLIEVSSPKMQVHAGDVLRISGWVQVLQPIQGNPDGVVLYDSLGGPGAALRWFGKSGWQRFEIIREATESGEFQLHLVLNGLGVAQFDELQVTPVNDPGAAAPVRSPFTLLESSPGSSAQPTRSPLRGELQPE